MDLNDFEEEYNAPMAECEECETVMFYNEEKDLYMCPCCGKIVDSSEINYDIPFGCRACGGPYPACTTSCKLFDD